MTDRNLDPRRPGNLSQYLPVAYADGRAPGADANTYILFDSTTDASLHSRYASGSATYSDFRRYILSLKNSQAGTFTASTSPDQGAHWYPYYSVAVSAAAANTFNSVVVPVEPHPDVQFTWTNGGVAQATWIVLQALDGEEGTLVNTVSGSGSSVLVTNFPATQAVSTTQLPATLGQKTKAGSLAVVLPSDQLGTQTKANSLSVTVATDQLGQTTKSASLPVVLPSDQLGSQTNANSLSTTPATDSVIYSASSLRSPIRGEVLSIPVTTSSVTYDIPDATLSPQPDYRGKYIDFYADGCTVYIQVSASTTAAVDESLSSTVASSTGGRFSIKPNATPSEPFVIPAGQWRSYPLPATGTIAVKGNGTGKLRTAISQT